jgi:hypothetical protein
LDENGEYGHGNIDATVKRTGGLTMSTLTIDGTGGDDTIVVNATGTDSGTYSINGGPAIAFSGVTQLAVSGGAGNDTLTVVNPDGSLFAPASGISYDGGGQSGDALEVVGGSASNGNYTAGATRDAGTLTHSSGTVTQTIDFAGIAPITNTVPAATFTINGTTGHDEINIANVFLGGMSLTEVSSPTFESIRFANKATVTINGQGGDDHVMFGNNLNAMETGLTTLNLTGVGRVDSFLGWFVPNLSISASGDVILQGAFINVAASVGGRFLCLDVRPLFIASVGGISGITANQDVVPPGPQSRHPAADQCRYRRRHVGAAR